MKDADTQELYWDSQNHDVNLLNLLTEFKLGRDYNQTRLKDYRIEGRLKGH